jgi:hypothetical protein
MSRHIIWFRPPRFKSSQIIPSEQFCGEAYFLAYPTGCPNILYLTDIYAPKIIAKFHDPPYQLQTQSATKQHWPTITISAAVLGYFPILTA